MTKEQIYDKYQSSWVVLINCRKNEKGHILGGEVALSTKSFEEAFKERDKYENEEMETDFFGIPPKDMVFLL
jgi:hypothetical protein